MKIRAVLFDLDGTVLSTLEDLKIATNAALAMHNFPTHTLEDVCRFVGNGIRKLIERAVPANTSLEKIEEVLSDFKTYYGAHCTENTRPYDGVLDMLRALKDAGILLALVSNKADFAVQDLAKQYFDGLFDAVTGERAGIPCKPAPDMVQNTLRELGVTAEESAFVGDSDVDVLTAKNSGLTGVFVTWGFRDAACLYGAGAQTLVDTPEQLAQFFLNQ